MLNVFEAIYPGFRPHTATDVNFPGITDGDRQTIPALVLETRRFPRSAQGTRGFERTIQEIPEGADALLTTMTRNFAPTTRRIRGACAQRV